MWRLVFIIISSTLLVTCWLGYELGLILPNQVHASDKPDALESLQQSIQEKEKSLETREEALTHREQMLADKEKILAEQIDRYEKVIVELRSKVAVSDSAKEAKVSSFRKVYEKIEPKKSAKILDEMEIGLASQIIGGMQGDKAAELLGQMSPERARVLTEKIIGSKRVPSSSKPGENTKAAEDSVKPGGDAAPEKGGEP